MDPGTRGSIQIGLLQGRDNMVKSSKNGHDHQPLFTFPALFAT